MRLAPIVFPALLAMVSFSGGVSYHKYARGFPS